MLDVAFREDQARSTQGYSAKRLKAGWNDHYLMKVLSQSNPVAKR
jgi:hypothetical protein